MPISEFRLFLIALAMPMLVSSSLIPPTFGPLPRQPVGQSQDNGVQPQDGNNSVNGTAPHQAQPQGNGVQPQNGNSSSNETTPHQAQPQANGVQPQNGNNSSNGAAPHQPQSQGDGVQPQSGNNSSNGAAPYQPQPQGNGVQPQNGAAPHQPQPQGNMGPKNGNSNPSGTAPPPPAGPAARTGGKPAYDGRGMARQFVIAHNAVRSVYDGKPLTWNKTIAKFARRWATQRINDCMLVHSPDSPYGENLFWSLKPHWTPLDVVRCWAEEAKYYDSKENVCVNNTVCGHYTQIVWRDTERFGCARVACSNNLGFLYVCSYDPPGNYNFEGPFGGKFNKSIVNPE